MNQAVAQPDLARVESSVVALPGPQLPHFEHPDLDEGGERAAFRCRCEAIASRLALASPMERMEAYGRGDYTRRELMSAAALRPDLMPTLNGEWEWIALSMADLD